MKVGTVGHLRKSTSKVGSLMCSTLFSLKDRTRLKGELKVLNSKPRRKFILVTNVYESKSIPGLTGIVIRRRRKWE